jgi:Cytochrome c3
MQAHNKRTCFGKDILLFLATMTAIIIISGNPSPLFAVDGKLLGDKHKIAGVDCSSCHKEAPPKQAVPPAVCTGCHGDYDAIAKRSEKVEPNPHDSHEGKLECGVCHHSHKESELYCSRCHAFGLKVP